MYEKIDALIEAIMKTDEFIRYQEAVSQLYQSQTMTLLSRYQTLMEDHLKMRDYSVDVGQAEVKKQLQEVYQEMNQHSDIQNYYHSYHQLNDLLEEVTQVVFQDISCDLKIERYQL